MRNRDRERERERERDKDSERPSMGMGLTYRNYNCIMINVPLSQKKRVDIYDAHEAKQKSWLQIQKEQKEKKEQADKDVDAWMHHFREEAGSMGVPEQELCEVS